MLYDRNIIGTSSEIFDYLRQSSENVRRRSSSLRNNFGKSSEIFGKWSEIFGKSSKTSLLVCLYNKQNKTWTLGDMEFIFESSHLISHSFAALTRSISMRTLEDKFHISARPCIILYLSSRVQLDILRESTYIYIYFIYWVCCPICPRECSTLLELYINIFYILNISQKNIRSFIHKLTNDYPNIICFMSSFLIILFLFRLFVSNGSCSRRLAFITNKETSRRAERQQKPHYLRLSSYCFPHLFRHSSLWVPSGLLKMFRASSWQNGFSYFTSTGSFLWFKSRRKNTQSIF